MEKKTPQNNRKSLLARIHIGKKQLRLEDAEYREMLNQVTGKRSCSDMHISELYLVLKRLEKSGFKTKKRQFGKRPNPSKGSAALMSKVEAILADNKLHWNYAHGMAKRMFKVEKVDWLSADQLWRLVAALEKQQQR